MKKFLDTLKNFVALFILCGIIFIGGNVSAEEVDEEAAIPATMTDNAEAMQIFRETILQTSKFDNRVFHQDIYFVVPRFTGELEFLGATERDSLKLAGSLESWAVDDDGNDNHTEIPFYLVQDSKNLTLYFQDDKKWKKMTSPNAVASFVDMFATPNEQELEKMISFVKDVNILHETDKYRTLLVKLDGEKIFEDMKTELAKDPEVQQQMADENANSFIVKSLVNCIETGFRNADIWYTWTVNKDTWQTDTMSFNLSNLIQSIASAALNDPTVKSMPEIGEILEPFAFYSEFKGYTSFLNANAKAKLEIPKKVLKAKEVESFSEE